MMCLHVLGNPENELIFSPALKPMDYFGSGREVVLLCSFQQIKRNPWNRTRERFSMEETAIVIQPGSLKSLGWPWPGFGWPMTPSLLHFLTTILVLFHDGWKIALGCSPPSAAAAAAQSPISFQRVRLSCLEDCGLGSFSRPLQSRAWVAAVALAALEKLHRILLRTISFLFCFSTPQMSS